MSRKREDFELVTIKKKSNAKPMAHQQPNSQKEESHYQCLSTTNREEPEQFMNASRKHETDPELCKPEAYINIAHKKKEAQPSPGLSQEKSTTGTADTDKDAADFAPTPAVLSHHRAMEILKTYIKAEPVTKGNRNTTSSNSDTESDISDLTLASSCSPPQQSSTTTKCNTYINTPISIGKQSSTSAYGDGNSPETDNLQSLVSSSKKQGNKCLLFSIIIIIILVVFLVFMLLLTFVWLNRSELEKNQAEDSSSTATSNMLIMNLTKQVRNLEESLNQTRMDSNTAIRNLKLSLSQMKMERDAAIGHLNAQSNMLTVNFTNQVRELEVSLRDLDRRLSASIDSHSSRLDTADTELQLMIHSHISDYSSLVSTSENNYSRLATRISGNYMDLDNRITDLQDSVDATNSRLRSGINLESRCSRRMASCSVTGTSSGYQFSCSTSSITRTSSVSHFSATISSHLFYSLLFRFTTMLSVWTASSESTVPIAHL